MKLRRYGRRGYTVIGFLNGLLLRWLFFRIYYGTETDHPDDRTVVELGICFPVSWSSNMWHKAPKLVLWRRKP